MERVFRKNLTKQLNRWVYNTFPERKLDYVQTQIATKSKDDYNFIAKIGSLETVTKLHTQIAYRSKVKAFRLLSQNMFNKRSEDDHAEGVDKVLELLNRQNALMDEIRTYKEENEVLTYDIENKDKNLREANETVTILSLRINYMITQKFINMIEKVFESV